MTGVIIQNDFSTVETRAIKQHCIANDIGLLDNGEFAVVELNDAWACGKYKEISNADYYRFLRTRWDEIISHK